MPEPSPAERALRLFIAVPPGEAVKQAAAAAAAGLRGAGDVRWVTPDRLHLTLKFLGNTAPSSAAQLEAKLEEIANRFSLFMVKLGGVGAFPSRRKPQTLWLEVRGGSELARLVSDIEEAIRTLGFPPEQRPFRGHLTLGRVRSARGLAGLVERLEQLPPADAEHHSADAEGECWVVEEFHLVRSVLGPAGPQYTVLRRFVLRGAAPGPDAP